MNREQERKDRVAVGLVAHVDAGKTSLSEALLYAAGQLRQLGRVDHGSAFLDTDQQERSRGITIFAKQAVLPLGHRELTLLDTPGHVDFSAEMERTLPVLDCAVLVISGTDGVQAHTRTLWRLLQRYEVPTFVFVNKMDLHTPGPQTLLQQLQTGLRGNFVDFTAPAHQRDEALAVCDEEALETYLDTGSLPEDTIRRLIRQRRVYPCWFGSALKLQGVTEFLQCLETFAPQGTYGPDFAARVFKISRDDRGERLTWLKVTGGALRSKMTIATPEGEEKTDQLRLYSGRRFQPLEEAVAGTVAAVTGLLHTFPGQGLGAEPSAPAAALEPVLAYRLILPDGVDPHAVLPKLRQLEEEDPQLRLDWVDGEVQVRLMGPVQREVLQGVLAGRFGLQVDFGPGSIVYQETIADTVEGVGHFEPLRHYAEVHLVLSPGPRGSGVTVKSSCPTDLLDGNWQRLILTHLTERQHPGVLMGAGLTDVEITLASGKAHLKHTEGGDFRQATYRAVRQGLMQAKSVLLEPYYDFRLELPAASVGRAINDIQAMGGTVSDPEPGEGYTVLTGYAPVAGLQEYWQEVAAYTRGLGQLSCTLRGYEVCHNPQEVLQEAGYDPLRDVDNPADSVFCHHGAGHTVPWNEVPEHMHLPSVLRPAAEEEAEVRRPVRPVSAGEDRELQAIFERTYGKVERRDLRPTPRPVRTELKDRYQIPDAGEAEQFLLVDGYNIIFAWPELQQLAASDLSAARSALEDLLADYAAFRHCRVILVFDAYKVKRNPGSVEQRRGIHIVYTKEAETADMYIEKTSYQLSRKHRVRVATSDGLEQLIVLGHGALRLSAQAFHAEMEETRGQIAAVVERYNRANRSANRPTARH